MKTVFCVSLEGNAFTGSDWYETMEARDASVGKRGAQAEIKFTMAVPSNATDDEITEIVDDAAWNKSYLTEESK